MQTRHRSHCDICLLGYYITNAHTIKFVSHQMNMHNCETWSVNSSTCSASTCTNLWMHIRMLISLCYAIWSERKSEKVFEVHGRAWEQGYQNVLAGEGVVCPNPLNTPAYRGGLHQIQKPSIVLTEESDSTSLTLLYHALVAHYYMWLLCNTYFYVYLLLSIVTIEQVDDSNC